VGLQSCARCRRLHRARGALEALAAQSPGPPRAAWLERVRGILRVACSLEAATINDQAASFARSGRAATTCSTAGMGAIERTGVAPCCRREKPGGWLRLGPLATIGSSLPNAIALQLAHPGRRVVAITGDGARGFYLREDTLVRISTCP